MAGRRDIRSRTTSKGSARSDARSRSASSAGASRQRVSQTLSAQDKLSGFDDVGSAADARSARRSASTRSMQGTLRQGDGAGQGARTGTGAIRLAGTGNAGQTRTSAAGTQAGARAQTGSSTSRRDALRNLPAVIPEVKTEPEPLPEFESAFDRAVASRASHREDSASSDSAARGSFQQPDEAFSHEAEFEAEEVVEDGASFNEPDDERLVSTSVGELRRKERSERLRKSSRRYAMRLVLLVGAIVVVLAAWAVVYNSPAFSIKNVQVNGVEHLTNDEMAQLASVPTDTTLLRVDTEAIATRVKQSSWVESVTVNRAFPDTLEINVVERKVLAIAEMPNDTGTATKNWAIAEDRMWLMPIPDASSEAAQTTSARIYEDADSAVHIVDLPFGTSAEIGQTCADENVNNALDILQEMTTDLSGQVIKISAPSIAETSLFLESGVEIAFGSAEDIRDKERTILQIMEDNPDGVAYINVRMVENPTWRSL